ncbi:MAG: STAS domain-containing protein [Sporichthyaceae bacterium]
MPSAPADARRAIRCATAATRPRAGTTIDSPASGAFRQIARGLRARSTPGCLTVLGEVDLDSAQALRFAVGAHAQREAGRFVLDLTELGYLDSVGIGALYALGRDPDLDFSIRVRNGSTIEKVLALSGVERVSTLVRVAASR